jgi:valyl-tRNA synthetase
MAKELDKSYDAQSHETKIYDLWERSGAFTPEHKQDSGSRTRGSGEKDPKPETRDQGPHRDHFVMAMPPPNVTGNLHIGHALAMTLEDIMARYHRLKGDETLYIPGTDHAGIATQAVIEKKLAKEGKRRQDLGREKFLEEVWRWKDEYHKNITTQLRRVGVSADWSREAFTFDEKRSEAVNTAFKHLYDKGLIYRGYYIVNWCPKCGTAVADDEVEYIEEPGVLYTFKYDKDFPIAIATTRPETKLGDTAVCVHPDDARYREYVGQTFKIDLDGTKRDIKIIADRSVDKEFGTGAVGVTPAHSIADWQLKDKYDLEMIPVIDEHGRMNAAAGKYQGLKVKEARQKIIEYLESKDLLSKEDPKGFLHNISVCYRCNTPIEPLPSLQWFVKTKPLAKKAIEAVKSGKIKIVPKRFEKIYLHWLENIRDWCISRQLWWGHRIPVWHRNSANPKSEIRNPCLAGRQAKQIQNSNVSNLKNSDLDIVSNFELRASNFEDNDVYIGSTPPEGEGWTQEDDVLDTWFSSALWPFATLGWPDKDASDFKRYYPTSVLETGYDIIFFWVARMVMMGIELTGDVPFHTVYLNGLVRDEQGRKMSKSLGNVVEPTTLIDQWGADALRMALVIGTTPGNDVSFAPSRAKGYRNFANKIWNASRFVLMRIDPMSLRGVSDAAIPRVIPDSIRNPDLDPASAVRGDNLTSKDTKILKEFASHKQKITKLFEEYKFSQAGEKLYHWFWHRFADVIIEESKDRLEKGGRDAEAVSVLLWELLRDQLIMLHPFMPFVTEAIWQEVPLALRKDKMLITAQWPS